MKRLFSSIAAGALVLALVAGASSPAFAGGYGHGYGYHSGYRSHGHGGNYVGAVVVLGLGLLALSLSQYNAPPYYAYEYRRPVRYRAPARVVYVQPAVRYVQPPAAAAPRVSYRRPLPPGCRMIREYRTRVTVGGRPVEAYGDACLLADGSWRRGPPKLVPN